jgi:hypothetical protein
VLSVSELTKYVGDRRYVLHIGLGEHASPASPVP